jgi:hypothetical protein
MIVTEFINLPHLEWQALLVLYRHKDRVSSPLRLVGFKTTIAALARHTPPLAVWVGKPSDEQVHITEDGIALYQNIHRTAKV